MCLWQSAYERGQNGFGQCGTRGRSLDSRRPDSTNGHNESHGWRRSSSAPCRQLLKIVKRTEIHGSEIVQSTYLVLFWPSCHVKTVPLSRILSYTHHELIHPCQYIE